jgi:predicted phage-related endonuclease
MLRGQEDEILAREDYAKHYAPVRQCGFVTNSKWGFTLGCSPDGLVGDEGLIECKSRGQKFQVQTVVEYFEDGTVPDDFILQVQGQLLVTERKWCDLISRCGGLHQITMRVEADETIQTRDRRRRRQVREPHQRGRGDLASGACERPAADPDGTND